jgi:hypothetical protein
MTIDFPLPAEVGLPGRQKSIRFSKQGSLTVVNSGYTIV